VRRFLFCILALALGPSGDGRADTADLSTVLEQFDRVQNSIRTLSADFREVTTNPLLVEPIRAEGRFYMTKPAAIRWEYTRPEEMRFVIAEDEYTGYFPAQHRAERRNVQRWREHIFRFFGVGQASGELEKFYDIRLDTADNDVPGPFALRGHAQHVGRDQQDVVGAGRLGGRHLQQGSLRVEVRGAADGVEPTFGRCERPRVDVLGPVDDLFVHTAVLTDDEKELGVCLVDVGGGTTDIAVFSGGAIRHTAVIPVAGDQVTNDIAVSMRTPTPYAEEIKIRYACALSQLANPDETIEVPSVGDRPSRRLARQTLAEIVEPRYEELFMLIRDELRRSGFEESVAAGVVLTGGSAKMEGAVELAEEIFHMPVRLGSPAGVTGLGDVVKNPIHATGVGLLLYGRANAGQTAPKIVGDGMKSVVERMKSWFQGYF